MVMNITVSPRMIILAQLRSYSLLDWFQLIGAILAFTLFTIKLIEFFNDKIKLSIDVSLSGFKNNSGTSMGHPYLDLSINADIRNTGRQPTTISKVIFESDNQKFTNIEMKNSWYNYGSWSSRSDEPIRVGTNDRMYIKLFGGKEGFIDNFAGMRGKVIFKTSHKDIIKSIDIPLDKKKEI